MTRPPLCTTFAVSMLTIAACGETPTQPETARDRSPAALSLALASNTWTTKAPVPNAGLRMGLSAGVVNSDGRPILYVLGGNSDNSVWYDDVQAYDLTTNSWTSKGRFQETQRSQTNGVGFIGGKLYVSGGYDISGFGFGGTQNTLYAYDPRANRVTRKADMPRHTADGVSGVINGKLYVLAGTCGYDCTVRAIRRLYRYDPGTNTWTTLAPCPRFHINGAGAAINGKFYVAGGLAPYVGPTADLDVYDPWTNTWTALAPMPQARAHAAGARMNSKLYVVGGLGRGAYTGGECEQAGTCARQTVYAYNPLTNTWSTKAPMPTARFGLAAAAVANSQSHILAVGGGRQSGAAGPSANELYTP